MKEIGLGPRDSSCYVNGDWQQNGLVVAVLGWNACSAPVCGNCVVWKGAPTTLLITIMMKIVVEVLKRNNLPGVIFTAFCGGVETGQAIAKNSRIPLVIFTGSSKVGLMVQQTVNQRYGKWLFQLSGNNAIIVMDPVEIELFARSVLFAIVDTAGQQCTTCRRLHLHGSIYQKVFEQLLEVCKQVKTKNPMEKSTVVKSAAIAYGLEKRCGEKMTLVFDPGGGTFDARFFLAMGWLGLICWGNLDQFCKKYLNSTLRTRWFSRMGEMIRSKSNKKKLSPRPGPTEYQ